jgi:hypothetical protein
MPRARRLSSGPVDCTERYWLRSVRAKCAIKQGPTRIMTNETKVTASLNESLISKDYFMYNFCVT